MIFKRQPKPNSFRKIYERIQSKWLRHANDTCTIIAFTSRLPSEGVTTVVAGLARAFGEAGSEGVLVLDITPNNKRVANLLNLNVDPVRLDVLESKDSELSSFITHDDNLGIDILTLSDSNQGGSNKGQCIQSLVEGLRSVYRVILIDAGIFTNSGRTHWLASSNYRVLIVDTTITTREILERLRKELAHSGIILDGSILNKRKFPIPNLFYWLTH